MKILCTICARNGSKGVKNKNFLKINKKYLIEYSLISAIKSKIFKDITVSTDSSKIKFLEKKYKEVIFIKRPKKLAEDHSNKLDAIRHATIFCEKKNIIKYDTIFDLDATSALRNKEDIKKAFKLFKKKNADNLFSVNESRRNPYFNIIEIKNNRVRLVKKPKKQIINRQKAPKTYDMNASIYIWKRKVLMNSNYLFRKKTFIYVMDIKNSIDIDSKFDFDIVKNQIIK